MGTMMTRMKMIHLLLLVEVKREVTIVTMTTLMRTLVTTLTRVKKGTVMKALTVMKVLVKTGLTWRLRLLKMTATGRMMATTGEERLVVAVAVAEIGKGTGIINLPRKVNTELRRSTRASTVIGIGTEERTGRGKGAVPPTRVQRRNLATTKNFEEEENPQTFSTNAAYYIFSK